MKKKVILIIIFIVLLIPFFITKKDNIIKDLTFNKIEDKNAPFVSNVIYQLKKRDIETGITVIASREKPSVKEKISEIEKVSTNSGEEIEFTKIVPSSTPFVACVAGIYMASYIVQEFKKEHGNG